jgi:hypothetical protein
MTLLLPLLARYGLHIGVLLAAFVSGWLFHDQIKAAIKLAMGV